MLAETASKALDELAVVELFNVQQCHTHLAHKSILFNAKITGS